MFDVPSAFGDKVSMPLTTSVGISCKYGLLDDDHETFSATGGSVGTDFNLYKCQSGTSVGGYGVIRSKRSVIYHPGEAMRARFSAMFSPGVALSLQFGGLFSLTETVAFGYDGAEFGTIVESHGIAECHEIEVTAAAGGAESATVTLDGDAATASLTATTAAGNAFEITRDCNADGTLGAKWNFFQNGDKVIAIAKAVGPKNGSFSFSSSTATATITELKAGQAKSKEFARQELWNKNNLIKGSFQIDPLKLNVYQVDLGYLGASSIMFSVYDRSKGVFIPVHIAKCTDETTTNIGNPNLKIGWTAASLGSSGTNLIVQGASGNISKVAMEHHLESQGRAIEASKSSIGQTYTNLITVRNRGHYGAIYNQGNVLPKKLTINNDNTSSKALQVEVLNNTTVGGVPNYQYIDESNSLLEYDTAGTTVTGGTLVDSTVIGGGDADTLDLEDLNSYLLPRETLTVAVRAVSSSANVDCALSWKEDK